MTSSEWPAAIRRRNARSSLRDVVEVQARGRLVEQEQLARRVAAAQLGCSARWPASLSRCASPPDSVGTGWPSRR